MASQESVCGKLFRGFDLNCLDFFNKYYQNIVLMNRPDVKQFNISSTKDEHRISFNLRAGATGFLYAASETSSSLTATFSKRTKDAIPLYTHKMQVPIVGVNEEAKTILRQLDRSDCFGAIQFKDGTIEIYGFNYRLKTSDYDYEAQSAMGGTLLNLESKYEEYDPPYVYLPKSTQGGNSQHEQGILDFNNLFAGIPDVWSGDFNDDFNNDFYIQ